MAPTAARPACLACGKPSSLKCGGCNDAQYCNQACQRSEWRSHKIICSKFRDCAPQPAENMRRVIFFPPNGTEPEFRWLAVDDTYKYEGLQSVDKKLVGVKGPATKYIVNNMSTQAWLSHHVYMLFDADLGGHNTTPNRAITNATRGRLGRYWYGPIMAYCGDLSPRTPDKDIAVVRDMNTEMYAGLVAFLIKYKEALPDQMFNPQLWQWYDIVNLHCKGERRIFGEEQFEASKFPSVNMKFRMEERNDISPISKVSPPPLVSCF